MSLKEPETDPKEAEFPWVNHTSEKLQFEYARLRKRLSTLDKTLKLPGNNGGFGSVCSDAFFQFERMNTCGEGIISPVEAWKNPKNRIRIRNYAEKVKGLNYSMRLLLPMMCKQFPPIWAGAIYTYHGAKNVFDPYAGWGDRCIAAMAMDLNYIGVDSNPNLVKPYKQLTETFETKGNIKIISDRSENVPIPAATDLVLTSPPFWKKGKMIEQYTGAEKSYSDFMKTSMIPVMKKCLKAAKNVCLYVPDDMYQDLVKEFGECYETFEIIPHNSTFHKQAKQNTKIYSWKGRV